MLTDKYSCNFNNNSSSTEQLELLFLKYKREKKTFYAIVVSDIILKLFEGDGGGLILFFMCNYMIVHVCMWGTDGNVTPKS